MSQISLTFPDGSVRSYEAATTGAVLVESISKSLAKKAVAYTLDGTLHDLSDPVGRSGEVEIVTREEIQRRLTAPQIPELVSNADIAEMLGVTSGATKAQLHRARLLLREALNR